MTVSLVDKRIPSQRISGLDLPNKTWFAVLSISGMGKLVNTQFTNDPLIVTKSKASKMAKLIDEWAPPDDWCNGHDKKAHNMIKGHLIDFLRNCNGFRSH
ncbi:hypothetical protein [Rosenbergiella nectarea]|uniref:DUF7739 domain-containing protein n=1 Tax=Rosenbergiella nectarea TaxID=988801 RepID=UPI001BDACBB5|nr:hypothetical protein [Rosenbergiella nectarea]MBT0729561.1 hypothetical protein [Rosenbergiella nectarea subsp. apis]